MINIRRVLGLCFALLILVSSGIKVYATDIGTADGADLAVSESGEPRVNEVCGGLPYHKLISSGWGTVYLANGDKYISNGAAWQCENCNMVMITEGDIYFNQMQVIGKWACVSYMEDIYYECIMYSPEAYGYCSSNQMDGYRFFLDA